MPFYIQGFWSGAAGGTEVKSEGFSPPNATRINPKKNNSVNFSKSQQD